MSNGISLYRSNNVQFLGAVYAELIRNHEDHNPLNTIDTVVGTPAMGKMAGAMRAQFLWCGRTSSLPFSRDAV